MATESSIIVTVDAEYPVAGQDNDSQGFRDNFSNISQNLTHAKNEIDDLYTVTAKLDSANNFLGNNILNANFVSNTAEVEDITLNTNPGTPVDIDWEAGFYHKRTITTSGLRLRLANWPTESKFAELYLQVTATAEYDFQIEGSGLDTFRVKSDFPYAAGATPSNSILQTDMGTNATSITKSRLFRFWTLNSGSEVFVDYLGEYLAPTD